jgi:hypothetical protein
MLQLVRGDDYIEDRETSQTRLETTLKPLELILALWIQHQY